MNEFENNTQSEIVEPEASMPASSLDDGIVDNTDDVKENVLAGVVGAFLFSLIGAALYFIVYQLGFIAGICGLVIVILASFGYQLFSGKKNSKKAMVVSLIMLIITTILAEYCCLSYEIFQVYKTEYDITIFDAMRSVPTFLENSELLASVIKDLVFALIFGVAASISTLRGKKQAK